MKFSVTVASTAERIYEIEADNQEAAKAKAMEFYDYDAVKFEFGVVEIYEISEETNG